MTEDKPAKPQPGTWDDTEAYPPKITFEDNQSIVVTFDEAFLGPKEMPSKDNKPDNDINDVFYIFNCIRDGVKSCIQTSAFTLLRSLKGHMPLASKTLIITKKKIGGKNMFYVETAEQNEARASATPKPEPSEVDTDEAGLEDSTM